MEIKLFIRVSLHIRILSLIFSRYCESMFDCAIYTSYGKSQTKADICKADSGAWGRDRCSYCTLYLPDSNLAMLK